MSCCILREKISDGCKRSLSIKVIRVNGYEWLMYYFTGAQQSVTGSPGFCAFSILKLRLNKFVERLNDEFRFYFALESW